MFLGIDLGTSGIKLALLNTSHQLVATADARLEVLRPHPLWSEQNPCDWWSALEKAIAQLRGSNPNEWKTIQAIGLSGQMHGAVTLDCQDQVIRPAILWNDGRSSAQCQAIEAKVPNFRGITGNIAMPGFTAPKLLWMQENEAELFAKIQHVLLPKDWLRFQLSGELVSEMSDASGTLWLDVKQRQWSEALLNACGLNLHQMPRLVEGNEVSGYLKLDLVERWGLAHRKIPIAGGAGDNAATAVGIGATRANQGFVSLGTSGVVFLASANYASAPDKAVHAFAHALPQRWHQMSVMLSAASAFAWLSQLVGGPKEADLSASINQLSSTQKLAAPLFLPYLSGERTPHNNANASALFFGLRHDHGTNDIAYAVMEGVCFGLKEGLMTMNHDASGIDELSLVGGGAQSDEWAQLLSDILQIKLVKPAGSHCAAAIGAARLAWLCTGANEADVCLPLPTEKEFACQLDGAYSAQMEQRFTRFKALYQAVKNLY
jgi:xylulokinase